MGITATITVVPRGDARKWPRRPDLPSFQLGKEWVELDSALEAIGRPACIALRGSKPTRDDDGMDSVLVRVPPATAKKVYSALLTISNDRLLAAIHERRKRHGWRLRNYEEKHKIAAFEALKKAYRLAAREGANVEIFIG